MREPSLPFLFAAEDSASLGLTWIGLGRAKAGYDECHEQQRCGDQHHAGAKTAGAGGDEAGHPRENRAAEAGSEQYPARIRSALGPGEKSSEDEGIGGRQSCSEQKHCYVARGDGMEQPQGIRLRQFPMRSTCERYAWERYAGEARTRNRGKTRNPAQ